MALQNLDISDTLLALGRDLLQNQNIINFCQTNFNKALRVFVGDFIREQIPTVGDCPYIVLTDFKKKEGQNIEFCEYNVTAFVGVAMNNPDYAEQDGVVIADIFDVGAKLMTLIEEELNSPTRNRPLSKVNTDGPFPIVPKHWVGKMDLSFRIYQTLGTDYQEEL